MTAVESLEQMARNYQAGSAAKEHLASVGLVMVIGPTAVGKSVLIDYTVEHNDDFGRSRGFTTRPIRSGESRQQYDFMEHDEPTIESISRQLKRGELVQIKIHPHTKYIYGSDATSYQSPYTMIDIMASAVDDMRELTFKTSHEFSIACQAKTWDARFGGRGDIGAADAIGRIREGVESLEWSLDQGDGAVWLDVTDDSTAATSNELVAVTRGKREPNPGNRKTGELLLAHLRDKL